MDRVGNCIIEYGISCDGMVCSGITVEGQPMFSSSALTFNTPQSAQDYLDGCLLNSLYNNFKLNQQYNYGIVIIERKIYSYYPENSDSFSRMFIRFKDSINIETKTSFDYQTLSYLVRYAVQYGFHEIGFGSAEEITNFIENPKYKDIVAQCVPYYVQQEPGKFITDGIKTCNATDKGAILLTTTKEMCEFLGIE